MSLDQDRSHLGLYVDGVFVTWEEHEAMVAASPVHPSKWLQPINIHDYFKRHNISMEDDDDHAAKGGASTSPPFIPSSPGHAAHAHHRESPEAKYARAALAEEATSVARARPGTRNDALNKAAFKLYGLVASGSLTAAEVDSTLTNAARAAGLDVEEIGKTLGSAAAKGGMRPRDLSHVGAEQREREAEFLEFADAMLASPPTFVMGGESIVSAMPATPAVSALPVVAPAPASSTASQGVAANNVVTDCPPGLEAP